jgi:hypothetical protein
MIKKLYLLFFFTFLTGAVAVAQTTMDVDFSGLGFLDNREYKDFVARSRTYSGMRTALDFGLNIDSMNHFVVGTNAIHEFGAQPYFLNANPIAYYSFTGKNWLFNAGEFPRDGLVTNYPRALLNDTLLYYRPNIEGLLARYQDEHFMEMGWIDWVSRQTATAREQFLFGSQGKYRPSAYNPFYATYYFLLLHDAGSATVDDPITDNGGAQLRVGMDFSHKTFLDSLSVEAGAMMSIQRTRGLTGLDLPKGFIASAYFSWHQFALFDEFYDGQGSTIYYGDAFYEKKFYNRLDMIWDAFRDKGLKGQFVLSIHRTPGYTSNQEAFRITYELGRRKIATFN